MGSSARGGFVGGRPDSGTAGGLGMFSNPTQGAPGTGTLTSAMLPKTGGKPAAPITYYNSQADIPQGMTGRVLAQPGAIGMNRMSALSPQRDNKRDILAMIMRMNSLGGAQSGGGGGRGGGYSTSQPGGGYGNSSSGGGYGPGHL